MKDEEYLFLSDVREKKRIANGAFYKRTHNGKGGRVRLPSDYLTKKELQAMNGEVKSYRMNEAISWAEFRAMPDDIKINYITLLRSKFDVPDSKIAKMMGVSGCSMSQMLAKLGLNLTEKRTSAKKWDVDGWNAFVGNPAEEVVDVSEPAEPVEVAVNTEPVIPIPDEQKFEPERVVPESGRITFCGNVANALKIVEQLLGGAEHMRISITWDNSDKPERWEF